MPRINYSEAVSGGEELQEFKFVAYVGATILGLVELPSGLTADVDGEPVTVGRLGIDPVEDGDATLTSAIEVYDAPQGIGNQAVSAGGKPITVLFSGVNVTRRMDGSRGPLLSLVAGRDGRGSLGASITVSGTSASAAFLQANTVGDRSYPTLLSITSVGGVRPFLSVAAVEVGGTDVQSASGQVLDVVGMNGVFLIVDLLDLTLSRGSDMQVKVTRSYVRGNDRISITETVETVDDTTIDVEIAAGATDFLVPFSFPMAGLKVLILSADHDLSVKTNSSSVPDNTFTVPSVAPYVWTEGSGLSNPLSVNVSALYVTNAGLEAALLQVRVGR